ncbi:MAG: hypothetical protein WAT19_11860 [Ferruginibacter sp.]
MKNIFLYIFFLATICSNSSCAQTKQAAVNTAAQKTGTAEDNKAFKFEKSIEGNFSMMEVDVLGNLYLVNTGNQLKKLDANGDSVAVFNDVKKYGTLTLIDVSNPLRPLLYYQGFSTVLMLDRLLSLRNSINFRKQNIFSVKTLAASYDNNIWIFDEQDFKLKKIDADGKLLQETTDWRMLFAEVPEPVKITDSEGFVYLYDEEKGFFIFDYYGSLKSNLPFLHWKHTAISGKKIYGFSNNLLNSYELQSLNLKTYAIPAEFTGYADIKAVNGKVYLLKTEAVEIYSVQ